MALRLRRGLNIDRQSIVFAEGELIYTTDSQEIFVGDGSTLGGIRVTGAVSGSPAELSQNLDLNGYNIQGSGNVSVTSVSGDGSGLTNLPSPENLTNDLNLNTNEIIGSGNININGTVNAIAFAGDGSGLSNVAGSFAEGLEYEIDVRGNVISNTSTIMVNNSTGDITGTFIGDGSQLLNLPTPDLNYTQWILDIISGDGSSVLVNSTTSTFTGTFIGDGSGLTNLPVMPGTGIEAGETYEINIDGNVVGFDSTVIVNNSNNTFTGTFIGDGSGLTNVPTPNIEFDNYRINIVSGDDSTLVVDYVTSTHYGTFIGDGSGLSNLPGLSVIEDQEYQINVRGNVVGLSSTVLVDALNETIPAEVLSGHANIDISGSIFTDDSTLIIDGITGAITGDFVTVGELLTVTGNSNFNGTITSKLEQSTASNKGLIFDMFRGSVDLPTEPNNFDRTFISWDSWSDSENTFVTEAGLFGYHQTGGGGYTALTAADSSLVLFNTAIEMDGVLGTILLAASDKINVTAPVVSTKYVQFGSYTTTERNALTPAFGMVIYNTTNNVFEGYQNTSGTTPEWVALS